MAAAADLLVVSTTWTFLISRRTEVSGTRNECERSEMWRHLNRAAVVNRKA